MRRGAWSAVAIRGTDAPVRRILSLVLAALLAVGVGTAIVASVKERVDATKLAARHVEVRTTPGNG
jgi:hypothetical protein